MNKLSKASQLSLLAVVILLGAVYFTVNTALQQQSNASHASTTTNYLGTNYYQTGSNQYCYFTLSGWKCGVQPLPTPTQSAGTNCHYVWSGFTYTKVCTTPTPVPPTPTRVPTPTTVQPNPTCAPPPGCFRNGVLICLLPAGGWCSFTPTLTPIPTIASQPTVLPTPTPTTVVPTNVPTPTPTVVKLPTPTLVPGSTSLAVTVGLQGVGTGGDSANPHSEGNMAPQRPDRTISVDIYDAQNQLVTTKQGTVSFDSSTGKFTGTVNLGNDFVTGLYTVKVKSDQYLRGLVPGIQTITSGQTATLPTVTLVAGDINGDNQINIVDYNLLVGCYSDLLPPVDCTGANNVLTDLNDDGHVNQFDYNLFLRELTNIGGQ